MSTEQKDLEQNALASRLNRSWTNFKQGKLIGYKWMALILLVISGLGFWWYIAHERTKANSARWVALDEAATPSALDEVSSAHPGSVQDKLARLQLARYHLGPEGIDRLSDLIGESAERTLYNAEPARAAAQELADAFTKDSSLASAGRAREAAVQLNDAFRADANLSKRESKERAWDAFSRLTFEFASDPALQNNSGVRAALMKLGQEFDRRAVVNILKARESFGRLHEDFKNDPLFKAECLLGLAKAEAALVAVPVMPNQLTEYRGSVEKVIDYLDQLSQVAAPDTPWAADSKRLADRLRGKDRDEFVRLMRSVFELPGATLPKTPAGPAGPLTPGGLPIGTLPVIPGSK